jgi:hypothetical protein
MEIKQAWLYDDRTGQMLGEINTGQVMFPKPAPFDALRGYHSVSCAEGDHERCTFGPDRPRHDPDCAPKCVCDHHYAGGTFELLFN